MCLSGCFLATASVLVAFAGISCRATCLAVKDLERPRVEFVLSHPFPSFFLNKAFKLQSCSFTHCIIKSYLGSLLEVKMLAFSNREGR